MVKVNYISNQFSIPIEYTLFQYQQNESFFVYDGDTMIGSIVEISDKWVQISGREMLQDTVDELGYFISKQLQNDTR